MGEGRLRARAEARPHAPGRAARPRQRGQEAEGVGPTAYPSPAEDAAPGRGRIAFHTFGCKLNQVETEAVASAACAAGWSVVAASEPAEAYVVNTCTVTARADHKARSFVRGLARARPGALIVVTGCSAEVGGEAFDGAAPILAVVPQSRKSALLSLAAVLEAHPRAEDRAAELARLAHAPAGDPFAFAAEEQSFHTRAFLKVQDGCRGRCAFCRVPLARGGPLSLDLHEAVRRAERIEERGGREIVITGVNVSAYASGGAGLEGLVRALLEATHRVRLRVSSLEPEAVRDGLAAVLAHPRVCPHFHLPVQSGSDRVLLRMKRRYLSARVRAAAGLLRAARGDPFLAADVMVGFPGETEADFHATRDLLEETGFASLHVFPFSPRPGTAAAGMLPRVAERVRTERAKELAVLSARLHRAYASRWVGRRVNVLLEGQGRRSARGTSENYLRVELSGAPPGGVGRIARAVVVSAGSTCAARFVDFMP